MNLCVCLCVSEKMMRPTVFFFVCFCVCVGSWIAITNDNKTHDDDGGGGGDGGEFC